MGCSQQITYGTVTLPFTKLSFEAAFPYDEAGTLPYVEQTVTVEGVFTADVDGGEGSLLETMQRIEAQLWRARQDFTIQWTQPDGTVDKVYRYGPGDSKAEALDIDVDWGPKPQAVRLRDFTGGLACEYSFTVRCRTLMAFKDQGKVVAWGKNPVISLVRTQTFAIDQNGMTTRTIAGSLTMVRARLGTNGADYFRAQVDPPTPAGFVRKGGHFTVQPDQLTATFEFVDLEVSETPPEFITSPEATISATTPRLGGWHEISLRGKFGAPKTTTKAQIVQAIYAVVRKKQGQNVKGLIVERRSLTVDIYSENSVSFDFQWRIPKIARKGNAGGSEALISTLLDRPAGSTGVAKTRVGPYGTAQLSAYVSPTGYDVGVDLSAQKQQQFKAGAVNQPGAANAAGPPAAGNFQDLVGSDTPTFFDKTPVLDFQHSRAYPVDNHVVVLPAAADGQPPVIQRTSGPTGYCIDAGFVRYAAKSAADCPPLPDPPTGYEVMKFEPRPSAGTPIGDGEWSEYCVHFWILSVRTRSIEGGGNAFRGLNLTVPRDVRRASETADAPFTAWSDRLLPNPVGKKG